MILVLAIIAFLFSGVFGNIVIVSTQNEFMEAIASGTTIELANDILLSTTLSISDVTDFHVDGNGFKVDGQRIVRCFSIIGDSSSQTYVSISNLTITNCACDLSVGSTCDFGGAFFVQEATLSLQNSMVTKNVATYYGGAFFICSSANVSMFNTTIKKNNAGQYGGAFYLTSLSTVELVSCSTTENSVSYTGGAFHLQAASATMTGSLTANNSASTCEGVDIEMDSESILAVKSECKANEYYDSDTFVFIDCDGDGCPVNESYPADLLTGICKQCEPETYSCAGQWAPCVSDPNNLTC